jgi:hypothetical protein
MARSYSVLDVFDDYCEEICVKHSPKQAKQICSETASAVYRVIEEWGFKRPSSSKKMTATDTAAIRKYMGTMSVVRLLHARGDLEQAFERRGTSPASRNTYGNRLDQFLTWCQQQDWWPSNRRLRIQDQCCPPRHISGRRHFKDLPLTARQGAYTPYKLALESTPPALQADLKEMERYLVTPDYPGRVCEAVKPSTCQIYLREMRLMLGYLAQYEGIPLKELTLSHLVPVVTPEELETLSHKEQKRLWKDKQLYFESWIYRYFEFLRIENQSTSPRTRRNKLVVLQRLGHFLYRDQVSRYREYRTIPLFCLLEDLLSKRIKQVRQWEQTRQYVAAQDRKWPDPVPGETALTTVRRSVVEPLRLKCRPRRHKGDFRDPHVIAESLHDYLKWAFLTEVPARRMDAYRTTKVAMSCPIERPQDVPFDGVLLPSFAARGAREKPRWNNGRQFPVSYLSVL